MHALKGLITIVPNKKHFLFKRRFPRSVGWLKRGAHLQNKLLEICYMKYETVVWYNKSINFNETAHSLKQKTCFLKFISWNSLIVLREEMLRNFRHCPVFRQFKRKDYNKLHEIYFLNVHRAVNMLQSIYLWNMFHAMFRRCALRHMKCDVLFEVNPAYCPEKIKINVVKSLSTPSPNVSSYFWEKKIERKI